MSSQASAASPRPIGDQFCALVERLIPPRRPAVRGRTGRPRTSDRNVLEGIAFVLSTGIGSTGHGPAWTASVSGRREGCTDRPEPDRPRQTRHRVPHARPRHRPAAQHRRLPSQPARQHARRADPGLDAGDQAWRTRASTAPARQAARRQGLRQPTCPPLPAPAGASPLGSPPSAQSPANGSGGTVGSSSAPSAGCCPTKASPGGAPPRRTPRWPGWRSPSP